MQIILHSWPQSAYNWKLFFLKKHSFQDLQ
jgi:hypothetical protein